MENKHYVTFEVPASDVAELTKYVEAQFGIQANIKNPTPYPDKRIFISYRRNDSHDITGRIYDWLVDKFGSTSVFRDVADIPMGYDFRPILEREVTSCDVMLVIIGKAWLHQKNRERLHSDDDYVRFEIATALTRDIPVIPVFVQNRRPTIQLSDLPSDLINLAYRQRHHVRHDPDFVNDMNKLMNAIEVVFRA